MHTYVCAFVLGLLTSACCPPVTNLLLQPFNGLFSRTTWVSRYQKGKTSLDFTGARDSEWQWHQLGHVQVCTSLQTDNHASTPPLSFLQAGCPSCRPTSSVKALKAHCYEPIFSKYTKDTFHCISSEKQRNCSVVSLMSAVSAVVLY